MKQKLIALALAVGLCLSLTACGGKKLTVDPKNLTVGATSAPHAQILEQVKPILQAQGITLTIKEFSDYLLLNPALVDGEIDANYFQHKPFLDDFNTKQKATLVSVGAVHYEPMGIFPGVTASLAALPDGATIAIPNDATNEARALLLLADNGLITMKQGVGLEATPNDIAENPKGLKFKELDAAIVSQATAEADLAVINGNYALAAKIDLASALATEGSDSTAAQTFANVVAVRTGDEKNEGIQALMEALQSDAVKAYIEETFSGAVVPMF